MVARLILTPEYNDGVNFLFYELATFFLDKFGPKIKNCQITLKLGNKTNSDILNLIAKLGFFILYWKDLLESNFVNKIKNCQFKLKFGKTTNSNILNLKVVFTFSILNWKLCFWPNLVRKIKNCQLKLKFRTIKFHICSI